MTASNSVRQSTAIADPNNPSNVLVPNATNAAAVTPSDSTVFAASLGLYIGTTGDVAVRSKGTQGNVTFVAVPAGTVLPIVVDRVLSTGTTASNIVRLY